jgi:membrane peptidoglycan carboxypeptidase
MRKALKIILAILICLFASFLAMFAVFLTITKDAKLDAQKLVNYAERVTLYDDSGNLIENTSLTSKRGSVLVSELNDYTINAFIASEDRNFYNHNGLNYKRIVKAIYKNITSKSFKEGASTISQQLIKNTHLSQDKTLKRKLNEIKLTKQLEKSYTKDEILEMYLNTIYFGHNCYGLQSAALFYFDKDATDLTIDESALVVGLLTSPNNYSPFKNAEKCLQRRNIVLKNMLYCGYISEKEYKENVQKDLSAVQNHRQEKYSDYISMVFDELEEIYFPFYELNGGCKIYTYLDKSLQNEIENYKFDCDNAVIITNHVTNQGGVSAYISTIGNTKRQPASTIKPLLVYAPAIEQNKIHTFTKILDEKIDYNGYSPENYDKKYHGYVTVQESVKQSLNIPAVKVLNSLSFEKIGDYANKMNIELEDSEKNLSLALGAMNYGVTLKQINDAYSIFSDSGNFMPSKFIKEIVGNDGKIIYKNKNVTQKVYNEGTCSLINQMLLDTTKSGTGRKLKDLNYDIATKTGTFGNSEGNSDAYAVSYTSAHTISVWLGDANNKKLDITGGGNCCKYVKEIANFLYEKDTPAPLETKKGTQNIYIDNEEYEKNNKIIICDEVAPLSNKLKVCVNISNVPKDVSTRFLHPTIQKPSILVENNSICIYLCQAEYYAYCVYRTKNNQKELIYDGKWKNEITENLSDGQYQYTVIPYYLDGKQKFWGDEIEIGKVNISSENFDEPLPDIAHKDWYNF